MKLPAKLNTYKQYLSEMIKPYKSENESDTDIKPLKNSLYNIFRGFFQALSTPVTATANIITKSLNIGSRTVLGLLSSIYKPQNSVDKFLLIFFGILFGIEALASILLLNPMILLSFTFNIIKYTFMFSIVFTGLRTALDMLTSKEQIVDTFKEFNNFISQSINNGRLGIKFVISGLYDLIISLPAALKFTTKSISGLLVSIYNKVVNTNTETTKEHTYSFAPNRLFHPDLIIYQSTHCMPRSLAQTLTINQHPTQSETPPQTWGQTRDPRVEELSDQSRDHRRNTTPTP